MSYDPPSRGFDLTCELRIGTVTYELQVAWNRVLGVLFRAERVDIDEYLLTPDGIVRMNAPDDISELEDPS